MSQRKASTSPRPAQARWIHAVSCGERNAGYEEREEAYCGACMNAGEDEGGGAAYCGRRGAGGRDMVWGVAARRAAAHDAGQRKRVPHCGAPA